MLVGISRPLWNKNIVRKLSRLEGRGQVICCIWRRVEGGEFSDFFVFEEWGGYRQSLPIFSFETDPVLSCGLGRGQ